MKIGIVCYPTVGGSGVMATELGHQLAMRGHEVHFITYEIPFRLDLEEKNIFFHQVDIFQYDLFKYPNYALTLAVKLAKVAENEDLDILHVHYAIPHATSAFLAKQILGTKKPAVITTLHGTDITLVGRDPAYAQIVKFSIEQSCGVTTVSESLKEQTVDFFDISRPIEVIYNFFSPNDEIETAKGKPNKPKQLLHASNFREVKRAKDVITIFNKVRKRVPCTLGLLGSGIGIEEVRNRVKELGIEDSVHFYGNQQEIDPFFASSDLFFLPSSEESFGLSALEAMAYGVPVIATNVGGIPEVVEDRVSGYLSEVGDTDAMASNTIKLLSNETLYKSFSDAARQRARTEFSADKIVPQYEAFYKRILGEVMSADEN